MFRGSQQQDAQEFLRCLLTQIHDEIKEPVPDNLVCGCGQVSCDQSCRHRDSMVSCASHDSNASTEVLQKPPNTVARNSPLLKKRTKLGSQKGSGLTSHATHSSPAIQPKFSFNKSKSKMLGTSVGTKVSVESIPQLVSHHSGSKLSLDVPPSELAKSPDDRLKWSRDDLYVVDLIMRTVNVHRHYLALREESAPPTKVSELAVSSNRSRSSTPTLPQTHKMIRSKDSASSISSSDSCTQGGCCHENYHEGGRDVTEGGRKEKLGDSTGSVEDVNSRVSIKDEEYNQTSPVSRCGIPPSPVPSHQSTSGVAFRESRKRGTCTSYNCNAQINCGLSLPSLLSSFIPYSGASSYH